MSTKTLISICGPTAVGKTAFSVELAKYFNTEIISCDSRQFYKEMSIGTAKPSLQEMQDVPHHFINSLSIHQPYSVGDYERDALELIHQLFKKQDYVVMVGGSMLFEKAVLYGLDEFPDIDYNIREQLNIDFKNYGINYLQDLLQKEDSVYYHQVDLQNAKRIIRALEICLSTGKPFSFFRTHQVKKRPFNIIKIGLTFPRAELYNRINLRVDKMMESGLLKEVQSLSPYQSLNALQTVGYQEIFKYFQGEYSLEFAIEEIKKNSRRFAKRQMTWYKKDENINWIEPPQYSIREIITKITS